MGWLASPVDTAPCHVAPRRAFLRETPAGKILSGLIFSAQVCYPESRRTGDCR
ncbi:hypothetical protein RISK_002334 [Rhodopirellula islandica]|uniref:Uncharacterized protein n=1 Tax=Rhodopirellula islandica TaxID=595434 RepID=A0A0J1BGM5_RHOIS|nr:hypothetical protein RISK_002334 [Rhodopirellula islandica]